MEKSLTINFPHIDIWYNEVFKPLFTCKDRYICLVGGRGSGKSAALSKMIVIRLLKDKFFRIIAYRKTYNTLADSCFKNLEDDIKFFNLQKFFTITKSPLSIKCRLNGNCVYFRGGDQVDKIKSIKDATALWVEEDLFDTYDEFTTVDASLRSLKAYCQTYFTINPIVEGDFTKHWFYNYFGYNDHTSINFRFTKSIENDKGETLSQTITSIHSTYRNNKFLSKDFHAKMELLKNDDPYLYTVNNLGLFARRTINGRFYKNFDITKNIKNIDYNSELPLFISFDFNTKPFLSLVIAQVYDKTIYIIDEMAFRSPHNYTLDAVRLFKEKYKNHKDKIYLTGDASGAAADTSQIRGHNNFHIIREELKEFILVDRVRSTNPSVSMRGSFINQILKEGYNDINIYVNNNCENLINDMLYGLEKEDGTKLKQNYKDKETGETYEKYFHMADALDYLVCNNFTEDYNIFKQPTTYSIDYKKVSRYPKNRTY